MPQLDFVANTPLYTTLPGFQHKAWRMEECASALAEVYARGKPIVVFVHGRGMEPNKSLCGATFVKGMAVWKLELGYDCSVVMFNWDSAFTIPHYKDRSRALGNVLAGGSRLGEFLLALAHFEDAHPGLAKPTLLAHSMGSIVVQLAIQIGVWPNKAGMFQQVVLSEPDADDVGHSVWMSALGNREKVFSTQNADDRVLGESTDSRPGGAHALGLGTAEPLAPNIKYIDLTAMGALGDVDDDHEVFGKEAMNGQANVCAFFEQALLGKSVTLDNSNVDFVSRGVIYRLKQRSDPNATCLRVPNVPRHAV